MASGESPRPKDSARHTAEDRERRRQRKEREGETEEDRERRRRRRSAHAGDTEEDGERRRRRRSEHARDTEEDGERRRRRSAHAGDTEEDGERRRRRRSEHTRDTEEDGDRRRKRSENQQRRSRGTTPSSGSSQALSAASLAKLALLNEQKSVEPEVRPQKPRRKPDREFGEARIDVEERTYIEEQKMHKKKRRRRDVSGALLEEGDSKTLKGLRGGNIDEVIYEKYEKFDEDAGMSKKKKKLWIAAGILVLLLAIIIPVAVVVSNKKSTSSGAVVTSPKSNGLNNTDVPVAMRNTQMDPSIWLDITDFNTTYTGDMVGGLPIIGLNSTWDDSPQCNPNVPALNTAWGSYATRPARGVNLGGWLSLEPFITPSLFNSYSASDGIIDEWTLTTKLGPTAALATLEQHYSTFVTEQTFIDIANAGLDHVRIPYSYWAVVTYDGDPYVFRTSWRYLLRAIEWARKHGLRINLDLHALPGSQNGWNHSGRLGAIGWLNGTDGDLNANRSLSIHDQLSTFFAQPRYSNIIAFYGLCNEPKMTVLPANAVQNWSAKAYEVIRGNKLNAYVVFGDGFRGLANWQGELQGYPGMVLDVHQYVIFNVDQIVYNHSTKVNYACQGWTEQAEQSMAVATGFGPTLFAEWSQADTDCTPNLNNVGIGNKWTGTYNTGNPLTQVLTPLCPPPGTACECTDANADPSAYSATYKQFLQMFAEAQMHSFEQGWGWFYWTWKTESSPQWSYQDGLAAGILPAKAYTRDFNCTQTAPSFSGLPEYY